VFLPVVSIEKGLFRARRRPPRRDLSRDRSAANGAMDTV
jgi:hypothetical protein